MSHIHELIDWTVGVLIVDNGNILCVDHKRFDAWMFPGGHIELHEDPEEAAHREILEETGLTVELIGEKPVLDDGSKSLVRPRWMNKHHVFGNHYHIGIYYLAQPTGGSLKLNRQEHRNLRWFNQKQIEEEKRFWPSTRFYALTALHALS